MTRTLASVAFALLIAASSQLQAQQQPQGAAPFSAADARATIDRYCVTCHNERLKTGGMVLDSVDLAHPDTSADRLEKVVRKLQVGTMPPQGRPRPDQATYAALRLWLEGELDRSAVARPNPGRTESLHRLNRAEYQNAVRDLLDIEGLDTSLMIPGDDASFGFDNVAGSLGLSPTHLEKYLSAARTISRIAVGDVTLPPAGETHMLAVDLSQDGEFELLPMGTRGGALVRRYFPLDGEYIIRFQSVSGLGTSEKEPNQIEVSVDGERTFATQVEQKETKGIDDRANADYELRIPIRAGRHDLAVTFVQTTFGALEDLLQPFLRPPSVSAFRETRLGGYSGPYVSWVSVTGPFAVTGPGDTPSRRRIFVCRPSAAEAELPCARKILTALARRAYRRPVAESDVEPLLTFYRTGRAAGGFEGGIQQALGRLLSHPQFLFRVERDPVNIAPATPYRISDVELASRLSFFLWSSIPDDQLLAAAKRGTLREPAVLARQVGRMLADAKSAAFVDNFAGQWLRLRNLKGVNRDTRMFENFTDNLREAFRRETELFFESIVREDRSVLDLLNADYTFVNEELARHYGIPGIRGSAFRRVTLTDERRRGLLGQGSILTVTSQPNRTSPVTRGKWILENLLGAPPPPPPPNIPALEETTQGKTLSMREAMALHRKNPVCAVCHNQMDPLGLALENFDAVGAWRDHDAGQPVNATGAMPDGSTFEGVSGLRKALLGTADQFTTALTEKLLIYALGRGLEFYDAPAVRTITKAAARHDNRFSSLVLGIVGSAPFQMRLSGQGLKSQPAPAAATARRE